MLDGYVLEHCKLRIYHRNYSNQRRKKYFAYPIETNPNIEHMKAIKIGRPGSCMTNMSPAKTATKMPIVTLTKITA